MKTYKVFTILVIFVFVLSACVRSTSNTQTVPTATQGSLPAELDTPSPTATMMPTATLIPATPTAIATVVPTLNTNVNLDESQLCSTQCTWDIGVNQYTDGSTAQFGVAWGKTIVWGTATAGKAYNMVLLKPGWYENITVEEGGVYVYNFAADVSEADLETLVNDLSAKVFTVTSVKAPVFADMPQWQSAIPSVSNSAEGPVDVGEGLEFPQLDGQEFSCSPENSPCTLDPKVSDNQIGIVFGVQIEYPQAKLAGPSESRCDLIVLDKDQYAGLSLTDARIEVYNVPTADPIGWFQNLVGERATEQTQHYGCPQWPTVDIWSVTGVTGHYDLTWSQVDGKPVAKAIGPIKK